MGYEVTMVQRALQSKLIQLGCWEIRREVRMLLYGKADFVITNTSTGQTMIIECKRDCEEIRPAILQVMGYGLQLKVDALAICVPTHTKTIVASELCERWGVRLGDIDVMDRQTWTERTAINKVLYNSAVKISPNGGSHEEE